MFAKDIKTSIHADNENLRTICSPNVHLEFLLKSNHSWSFITITR